MAPYSPPSPRRFLPQPIEETTRSNRASPRKDRPSDATGIKPPKELPQPVETSATHYKPPVTAEMSHDHTPKAITSSQNTLPQPMDSNSPSPTLRKFAPHMIETSRRRRKSTDTTPCVTPTDKTDYTPGPQDHLPRHMRQLRPTATPIPSRQFTHRHLGFHTSSSRVQILVFEIGREGRTKAFVPRTGSPGHHIAI